MAIAFSIDGAAVSHKPSRLAVRHRRPPHAEAGNGGVFGQVWTKDRTVTVTWLERADHGALAELLTARNERRRHTIAWNDPDGTARSVSAHWNYPPSYTVDSDELFGAITAVFEERP